MIVSILVGHEHNSSTKVESLQLEIAEKLQDAGAISHRQTPYSSITWKGVNDNLENNSYGFAETSKKPLIEVASSNIVAHILNM